MFNASLGRRVRTHARGSRSHTTMIEHRQRGDPLWPSDWHALEAALGLPPSPAGRRYTDIWDDIARECGLPTAAELREAYDGPGIDVLPAFVWNRAVDIANERTAGTQR
jgi:hypothetical protein